MKRWMLEILVCPECKAAPFRIIDEKADGNEIISGILRCNCGREYKIINYIPRFLSSEGQKTKEPDTYDVDTKKKFEFQWKTWGKDEVIFGKTESECFDFFEKFSGSSVTKEFLKGKIVLDAGCGHGRFAQIFAKMGARSVGLDLGEGVEIAQWRIRGMENASIVQADIMKMPFKDGIFEYIWSNGVIHHTPNTRRAFSSLVRPAKEGGYVDIWLYPKGNIFWEVSQKAIRFFTTKLYPRLLSWLCYLPVPLLSIVSTYSNTRFPKNSWRECAQVIYDWYSPKYQWHHTIEEVTGWYQEEGFEHIESVGVPVAVSGRKKIKEKA